jgi:hypothetical protein
MAFKGLISFLHNLMFFKYSKPAMNEIRVFYAIFTYIRATIVSENMRWCKQGQVRHSSWRQKDLNIHTIPPKLQQTKSKAKR